jgi:hypothetical protein
MLTLGATVLGALTFVTMLGVATYARGLVKPLSRSKLPTFASLRERVLEGVEVFAAGDVDAECARDASERAAS